MQLYRFDPRLHWVPRLEVAEWLRRRFEEPRLFVFKNIEADEWCVSLFQDDRPGQVEDILPMGPLETGPQNAMSLDKVRRIDYLLNGPSVDPCKKISRLHKDMMQRVQDHSDEESEIKRWMGRNISFFQDNPLFK